MPVLTPPTSLGVLADAYSSDSFLRWVEVHFEGGKTERDWFPGGDPDGDGGTNYFEFITGTDPLDRDSVWQEPVAIATFAGTGIGDADGPRLEAEFNVPIFIHIDSRSQIWIVENTVDGKGAAKIGAHRIRRIDDLPNSVVLDPFGHLMVTYWSIDSQIYWVDRSGVIFNDQDFLHSIDGDAIVRSVA